MKGMRATNRLPGALALSALVVFPAQGQDRRTLTAG